MCTPMFSNIRFMKNSVYFTIFSVSYFKTVFICNALAGFLFALASSVKHILIITSQKINRDKCLAGLKFSYNSGVQKYDFPSFSVSECN